MSRSKWYDWIASTSLSNDDDAIAANKKTILFLFVAQFALIFCLGIFGVQYLLLYLLIFLGVETLLIKQRVAQQLREVKK